MAHISFLSNFFGLLPRRNLHTSAILFGRHFMYGDVSLFLFITADRTLVASRLHNYLKTIEHGGVVAPSGGKGEEGRTQPIIGYEWAAGPGWKPWPCLGPKCPKILPKIHTLFRTKPSISLPCLEQRTKCTKGNSFFPLFSPTPSFVSSLVQIFLTNSRGNACHAGYLVLMRGTRREYSSKPLKHSIVKRILVFKR